MPSARFSLLKECRYLPGNPQKQPEVIPSRQAMRKRLACLLTLCACLLALIHGAPAQTNSTPAPVVLHAARLLDIETGRISAPGEVLVRGERIAEVGSAVSHPAGAQVIDLDDTTLLPGLIDAHVHLFLHPGAEDLQTVQESVPQRAIMATLAARADLMAGYTAERDMGTEGAGSADTAVRNAIDQGLIPGPRLRISGNAIFHPGRARRCHRL